VFQPVPEKKAGKVRIHFDVTVDDKGPAIDRVIELGGQSTGEQHDYDEGVVVHGGPARSRTSRAGWPRQESPQADLLRNLRLTHPDRPAHRTDQQRLVPHPMPNRLRTEASMTTVTVADVLPPEILAALIRIAENVRKTELEHIARLPAPPVVFREPIPA